MNTELLEKIAAHIEAHPEEFDMSHWCGTACCISGRTLLMSNIETADMGVAEMMQTASSILDITGAAADRLFLGQAAPRCPFYAMWGDKGEPKEVQAKTGAARIRHFIATEGAE